MKGIVIGLILWVAAFVLYQPSAGYNYVYYDDVRILANHPELYNQASFKDTLKAIFIDQYPREEPLIVRDLSWALDSHIFGFPNPHGFHYVNVLIHATVVLLLFLFMLAATRRRSIATLTALCFLPLAIHVDTVAWIIGRKDLLSSSFALICLLCHIRGLDTPSPWRRWLCFGASLAFLVLSQLSKVGTVVLPGVLFMLAVFLPDLRKPTGSSQPFPWHRLKPALYSVLPHLVVSVLISHWYYGHLNEYGRFHNAYIATPLQHLRNLLLIDPMALLSYLRLLFFPHNPTLFLTWPGLDLPATPYQVIFSASVILASLGSLVWLLFRRRDIAFFVLSFFLLMVPFMNIRYTGIWVATRYLYFPSFCLIAALILAVTGAISRRPRILGPILGLLLAAFAFNNFIQQQHYLPVWQNAETLWAYEIERPDAHADAFYNLASYYYTVALGQPDPAAREAWFRKAATVTARARATFTSQSGVPSPHLHNVIFIEAQIALMRNEPRERQLALLEEAERLYPLYDPALWQLMVIHFDQALAEQDPVRREQKARQAFDYFARHLKAEYREVESLVRDRDTRASFRFNFPFLKRDLDKLP